MSKRKKPDIMFQGEGKSPRAVAGGKTEGCFLPACTFIQASKIRAQAVLYFCVCSNT